MINEEATGTVTVNGEKQSYDVEGGLFLPETVKEYEAAVEAGEHPFDGLLKEGEKGKDQTLRAIVDYERRRQRQKARPSESRGTGAQKFQRAIGKALREGKVSQADIEAALASLNL